MATILPALPERVWPWPVQMGGGRGGWYSWDWLDNNGEPSVDRIVPEWQSLEVGRHLKGPANRWTVVVVEPNRTLVLQSSYGLPPRPFPGPLPRAHLDGIWGFHLRPAPGGRTRLVIRTRCQAGDARDRSPGRSACWWGNPCTSSCRPASSIICAPGSARRRDAGRAAVGAP